MGNAPHNFFFQLISLGFDVSIAKQALEQHSNDINKAMDYLLNLQQDGKYEEAIAFAQNAIAGTSSDPSTSSAPEAKVSQFLNKAKEAIRQKKDADQAFRRFREDFNNDGDDYLDMPLEMEEQLVLEYKRFLGI